MTEVGNVTGDAKVVSDYFSYYKGGKLKESTKIIQALLHIIHENFGFMEELAFPPSTFDECVKYFTKKF